MGGGLFLKYGGHIILDMRKQSVLDTDPIKREEGMKIMISVKKNHVTPRVYPYVKVPHFVIYGEGTEVILTTLKKAVEKGILTKSGGWVYWPDKDLKWNGAAAFRTYMRENPEELTTLRNLVGGQVEVLSEQEMAELHINPEEDQNEEQEFLESLDKEEEVEA